MRLTVLATIVVTLATGCPSRRPAPADGTRSGTGDATGRPSGKADDRPPRGPDLLLGAVDAGSAADCVEHRLAGCTEETCVAEALDQGASEPEAESACAMYCVCGL